jgi:hypothetical protein
MTSKAWTGPFLALLAAACSGDPSAAPAPGTGDYGAVTRDELLGEHVWRMTGPDGTSFRWIFAEKEFTVTGEGGPIPAPVVSALAGGDEDVSRIEGDWELRDRDLVLSDVRATWRDGVRSVPDVIAAPFRTSPPSIGPTVVRIELGGRQFVKSRR